VSNFPVSIRGKPCWTTTWHCSKGTSWVHPASSPPSPPRNPTSRLAVLSMGYQDYDRIRVGGNYHDDRGYSYPDTLSDARQSSDYTTQYRASNRRYHSSAYDAIDDAPTYPAQDPDCISPYDKSDYRMIKDGGWDGRRHFMESHGTKFDSPKRSQDTKESLDAYRHVDAQAASEMPRDQDYDSDCVGDSYDDGGRGPRNEYRERYYGSDFISDCEDDERIEARRRSVSSQDDAIDAAGTGRPEIGDARGDGAEYPDGSDGDLISDHDSTDAIGYDSDRASSANEDVENDVVSDEDGDDGDTYQDDDDDGQIGGHDDYVNDY